MTGESEVGRGAGERSALVHLYLKIRSVVSRFSLLVGTVYTGFWLGVLTRKQHHTLGELFYSRQHFYWTDEWNKRGLFDWEKRVVERSFSECKKLLVAGAGGGREVIALRKLGFDVAGFESHPGFVRFANGLLEREGLVPDIRLAPWDHCPKIDGEYDGVIVGWGAYMHIRGREGRVRFLRELRDMVVMGSPILLSFYTTSENSRHFRWVAWIGGVVARVLGREPVHVGDSLVPNYTHFFTKKRLESELMDGGFEPITFETVEYGHAVGRAL